MSRPENKRYPHTCRIIRKTTSDPMEEEEDFSPMDSDVDSEESDSESVTTVIYEGECRSYHISTTSDKGEVITSNRGLALPMIQDDWTEAGYCPEAGDEVIVDHGISKEYGRVVDKNVSNFGGTHLTWIYGRN